MELPDGWLKRQHTVIKEEFKSMSKTRREILMKQTENTPYLETKVKTPELTKEEMIYGGGETLSEIKKKDEGLQLITEG